MNVLNNYKTDTLTSRYDKVKSAHTRQMLEYLRPLLPKTPVVLEIGPGHGHFAQACIANGFQYDAIEPSQHFRESLIANDISVTDEMVPPIRRPKNTYDLVYGSMLIENLPTSREAGEFALDAFTTLKPSGYLVLLFPNYLTWGSFFFDEHYTHSFETTPRRIQHLLTSQGFNISRTEHLLGWYWVEETFVRNLVRHTSNILMWFVHLPLSRWLFKYIGLEELHWKVRKTFFESVLIVAEKPIDSPPTQATPDK